MANRAYVSVWSKNFAETTMLNQFERLLETVPFSATWPGFTGLVIHAVDPTESVLVDHDLRARPLGASEVAELARAQLHTDCSYEAEARWDLWVYDLTLGRWRQQPQPLTVSCHGEEYDSGVYAEAGHFQADIGFEHLFTGHARLLGASAGPAAVPQHPAEAEFLAQMTRPENLREYHQKTRENIQELLDWMRAVEQAVPVERYRLWSEGEENFEARLDEILAVR